MPDAADSPALFLLFGKQRRPNPFPQRLPEKHSLLPGLFPTGKYHRSGYLYGSRFRRFAGGTRCSGTRHRTYTGRDVPRPAGLPVQAKSRARLARFGTDTLTDDRPENSAPSDYRPADRQTGKAS